MARARVSLALALLALLGASSSGLADDVEGRATRHVLNTLGNPSLYEKSVRPSSAGGSTRVNIQTYFRDLTIDDVNFRADLDITFRMIWEDSRLAYNTSEFRGVQYVTLLDPTPVWVPDAFFVDGSAAQSKAIHPEVYLRVFPNGTLMYSTRLTLHQDCPMDLSRFPHDCQTCDVKIASYGYTVKDLVFQVAEDGVIFRKNIHNDRFQFDSLGNTTDTCEAKTATGEYSCVRVSISVRRRFPGYLTEWYVPTVMLVVVAMLSFLVPNEEFLGRLLLTLVSLIAQVFFATHCYEQLASVPYTRAMDIFMGISVTIIFFTLVSHVWVNKDSGEKEAAVWKEEGGAVMQLVRRVLQRRSFYFRVLLVSVYLLFLFVYFVAYCGTA